MYHVVVSKKFQARQGLRSPVRAADNLPGLVTDAGFDVTLYVAIAFTAAQINDRGWFVDTDAIDKIITAWTDHLTSDTWTNVFGPRPTFERVAKHTYDALQKDIPQLAYVEFDNHTIGVKTRYTEA